MPSASVSSKTSLATPTTSSAAAVTSSFLLLNLLCTVWLLRFFAVVFVVVVCHPSSVIEYPLPLPLSLGVGSPLYGATSNASSCTCAALSFPWASSAPSSLLAPSLVDCHVSRHLFGYIWCILIGKTSRSHGLRNSEKWSCQLEWHGLFRHLL